MGVLNVNGLSVLAGTIRLPRVGVWRADVRVDTATAQSGSATVATADGGLSLKGTIVQDAVFQNVLRMRIVGGAAGLHTIISAKQFQGAPLKLALQYILGACGEALDDSSDATITSTVVPNWVIKGNASGNDALTRILEPYAASWRVLPNGKIWIGTDTYPAAPAKKFDVLEYYPDEARAVLGCDQPFLLPGVTLTVGSAARKVSQVVHEIGAAKLRTEVWFDR